MRELPEGVREMVLALRTPATAATAARFLANKFHPAVTEALCQALSSSQDEVLQVQLARLLDHRHDPIVNHALIEALGCPSGPVRLEAARVLARRQGPAIVAALAERLRLDRSPAVRRAALGGLARMGHRHEGCLSALILALTDPVWRVRMAAVEVLLQWCSHEGLTLPDMKYLITEELAKDQRLQGAMAFLDLRQKGHITTAEPVESVATGPERPWSNPDPVLVREQLARRLGRITREDLPDLLELVTLQEGFPLASCMADIRELVRVAWLRLAKGEDWLRVHALYREPRIPEACQWADDTLAQLSGDRPAPEGEQGRVTRSSYFPSIHPGFRIDEPSGHGRHKSSLAQGPRARRLGGLDVSPLGISGRYGLPRRGYELAMERGVNLLFWEPSYHKMTAFLRGLVSRESVVLVSGTFESEPLAIRRDLDRLCRAVRSPCIDIFLLFWVRHRGRISDGVMEELVRLREAGRVRAFGISTHDRPLAAWAMEAGLDVVMVRHSAAYPGAEREVFPLATRYGTGVLTFSALCYGRLLASPFTAADFYRYSLSQEGVAACLSAPQSLRELEHNLEVLRDPGLSPERQEELREAVRHVRPRDKGFNALVRWR